MNFLTVKHRDGWLAINLDRVRTAHYYKSEKGSVLTINEHDSREETTLIGEAADYVWSVISPPKKRFGIND